MIMKHALLFLVMLLAMPSLGIAHEFSYDNVSRKYPLDSEYFAFEASQEIAKTYKNKSENFILIPVKNDRNQDFIDKFSLFMVRSGFKVDNKGSDGIVLSYTFDFIDKNRAYLRMEMSDGKHIGVVRMLGETSPFIAPAAPAVVAEEIKEENILPQTKSTVQPVKASNSMQPANSAAQSALTELQAAPKAFTPLLPPVQQPKVWILKQGSLMNQLDEWAKGENWQLIWKSDYDLELNASATFAGNFIEAVTKVFHSLQKKNNGLRVNLYKQNKVIEVIGE